MQLKKHSTIFSLQYLILLSISKKHIKFGLRSCLTNILEAISENKMDVDCVALKTTTSPTQPFMKVSHSLHKGRPRGKKTRKQYTTYP
jgi:hypothetical protein